MVHVLVVLLIVTVGSVILLGGRAERGSRVGSEREPRAYGHLGGDYPDGAQPVGRSGVRKLLARLAYTKDSSKRSRISISMRHTTGT